MADAYLRYGDIRQHQMQPTFSLTGKRPRTEYDFPGGQEMSSYYARDDERGAHNAIRATDSVNASYDHYLRSGQPTSYGGGELTRSMSGGLSVRPVDDPRVMGIGGLEPAVFAKGQAMGSGSGRPELSLPFDASSTLFVEGLPANCKRREVAHIFRPFVGYKEVRLVTKEVRRSGDDPLVLSFVDFESPAHAATAMDALQEIDRRRLSSTWKKESGVSDGFGGLLLKMQL